MKGEFSVKRFFSVVLVLCLLLCSVSALAQTAFTPGVYTGQAQGKMGLVTVEVTLTEDAVESVAVVSHEETAGLSDPAIESIPAAIVENQSLAVDTVAGATMTSEAIIAAVADCIKQAGGDVDALQTVVEKEKVAGEKVTVETPVVVVGAGGAGLAAAVPSAAARLTTRWTRSCRLRRESKIPSNCTFSRPTTAATGWAIWN